MGEKDDLSRISIVDGSEMQEVVMPLSKEEIKKIILTKPCVAIRSVPSGRAEVEQNQGVERGDFLKISRPKCMDDSEFGFNENNEELEERIKTLVNNYIDVLGSENILSAVMDNSIFGDLYNQYLKYKLVTGFLNWTYNHAGITESSSISELLGAVGEFELIRPNETSIRQEEYMGFEKNASRKIDSSEIKSYVGLSEEEKSLLEAEMVAEDLSTREAAIRIADIMYTKVVGMIRVEVE